MTKTIYRTFEYRMYPTKKEIEFLEKNFTAVRFIYNHYREEHEREYKEVGRSKSRFSMNQDLTRLLKNQEYAWLHVATRSALTSAIQDLDQAFKNFYRRVKQGGGAPGYPKFRNKHRHNSFRIDVGPNMRNSLFDSEQRVIVSKLADYIHNKKIAANDSLRKEIAGIRIAYSRPIEGIVKDYTIKRTSTNKYFITFNAQQEVDIVEKTEGKEIGIDLGTRDYVVTNEGVKFDYPRYLEQSLDKLTQEQSKLERMKKGGNNRKKQALKVAKVHEKIANQRKNFQHKLANQLIKECKFIATETLDIKNMLEMSWNSRHIHDAAWSDFMHKLEYKAKEHGVEIKKIKKYFASSKTCFHCETINANLKPSERTWSCSHCKVELDRDVNAAQNILRESRWS